MAELKKPDYLAGFKQTAEQSAKQKLKLARWQSLQEQGLNVNIQSVNRVIDVMDAGNLKLDEEDVKSLMTKKAKEKYEEFTNQ